MSKPIKTECLGNIIGLTRSDCECFEVGDNESDSNLWLDELEGLNLKMADGATDCETGSLADLLKLAREQGIAAFKTDYASKMAANWKQSRSTFLGIIGKSKEFDADYNVSTLAGQRIVFAPVKNGIWKITRIGTLMDTTGTVELNIYNNISDDPLHTFTLNATANKTNWNVLPETIYLPMYSVEVDYLEYFFVYTTAGKKPKNAKLNCSSCSGKKIYFNCNSPQIDMKMNDARLQFVQWCNVTGINGSTIESLKAANASFVDCAMGIFTDGEMKCNSQGIACNDTDYEYSNVAKVKAYATWYRSGAFLINMILSTQQVNRYTMLDREALYGKRNHYIKEYGERIEWLTNPDVSEVKEDILQSGCMECLQRMVKRSTL